MESFLTLTTFHWLVLGLLLLIAEMLGASGFLVGAAVAALAMSALTWAFPEMALGWQICLYAVTSIAATIYYFKVFRKSQLNDEDAGLNQRTHGLIGHQFKLPHDVDANGGKVQIGDTMWKVIPDSALSAGTQVEVVGATEMSLQIAEI